MNWERFSCSVPGKWVLAGEHAVLRGASAVALPHPELGLKLRFEPDRSRSGLRIDSAGDSAAVRELIESVRESWGEEQGRSFEMPSGTLTIQSTIPIGAGLGSSAALCVAMTRWFAEPLRLLDAREQGEFATRLEHRFHGRSSGMDIAVISAGEPISFGMTLGPKSLGVRRLPRFTFHDTGLRARTSECVYRVEKFREEEPTAAMRIDEAMAEASRLAMEGLIAYDRGDRGQGVEKLVRSMNQAQECFYSWRLVPGDAQRLEYELRKRGALACKITGAGGGGMLVALWKHGNSDS